VFSEDHQSKEERKQVLNLIFNLAKSIFEVGRYLSLNPCVHPELIQSGFAWKCLQHSFFSLLPDFRLDPDVIQILRDSTYTLQHLTSFASIFIPALHNQNLTPEQQNLVGVFPNFKILAAEREKEIIVSFYSCINKLLEKKIIVFLECWFDFAKENKSNLKFFENQEKNHLNFLKIFSIPEESTPELVWNDQTR